MGKHSGEPTEETPARDVRRITILGAGTLVTLVIWVYLVINAITFGTQAHGGQTIAWFLMFLATVGATACLFLALILAARLRRAVRGEVTRRGGGRRAAR